MVTRAAISFVNPHVIYQRPALACATPLCLQPFYIGVHIRRGISCIIGCVVCPSSEMLTMIPEERERISRLVQQIQMEKDQKKFTELISELNALLGENDKRCEHPQADS
jgi:heat shock protein HspQ